MTEIDKEQAIKEIKKGTKIGKALIKTEKQAILLSLRHLKEKYFGNQQRRNT